MIEAINQELIDRLNFASSTIPSDTEYYLIPQLCYLLGYRARIAQDILRNCYDAGHPTYDVFEHTNEQIKKLLVL